MGDFVEYCSSVRVALCSYDLLSGGGCLVVGYVQCRPVFSVPLFRQFLFFCEPGSEECANNPSHTLATCRSLSIPVAEHKIEGPACCMTFLGIEIDTNQGCLHLPENKLRHLCELLREWLHKQVRELLPLVSLLHHAATVIKPGQMFVQRLINLPKIPKELHSHVQLKKEARLDIWWWVRFIKMERSRFGGCSRSLAPVCYSAVRCVRRLGLRCSVG